MGSGVTLTLGGVPFKDMEIPEKISFGGKQRISVQNLIGGGRVVTALGIDDGNIKFSGVFSGRDAVSRVQILDAARAAGAQLPLCWDEFFYIVVIQEFAVEYQKTNLIPFSLICIVVTDPISEIVIDTISSANAVLNDLESASSFINQSGLNLSNFSNANQTALSSVMSQIGTSILDTDNNLSVLNSQINTVGDPFSGAFAVQSLNTNAGQLAALVQMSGFTNRASANQVLG